MLQRSKTDPRSGVMAIEAALVYPVMLFLILGLVVGGIGVFRYQQVACQAREAARWAAVRGSDFQKYADQTSPTQADIRAQAVIPFASGMDPNSLTVKVEWINQGAGAVMDWDLAYKDPLSLTATGEYVTNSVRVTVTYQYSPNLFFVGAIQLQSVCEHPMAS